jgi:hypothetical protein
MATVKEICDEHRAASKRLMKKLNTPEKARQFLIRAGILEKSGRRLAKKYR